MPTTPTPEELAKRFGVTPGKKKLADPAKVRQALAEARQMSEAFERGEPIPDRPEGLEPDEPLNGHGLDEEQAAYDAETARAWDEREDFMQPKPKGQAKPEPFEGINAAFLKGVQRPREFLDSTEIFPKRNVSLVMGDGGIGKSRLMLQLSTAMTTQTQWLGVDVLQCPVVYVSCEDDADEIANRLNEICDAEGIDLATAQGLTILDMVGKESVLTVEERGTGSIKQMPAYHRMRATLERDRPGLVIIDGLADVFGGNENNRVQVKQFINLMRGLCIDFDCHVSIIGHPSNYGLSNGSGTSGSTGWNNAVRCRPYLHKAEGDNATDDDLVFEVMKANYRKEGLLKWEVKLSNGRFVRRQPKNVFDRITLEDVERVKLRFGEQRFRVSEQAADWGGYAVADLLGWDVGRGIGAKERSVEQNTNRSHLRKYLASWVKAGTIFVVDGFTIKRERTQFYSNKPGLSVV